MLKLWPLPALLLAGCFAADTTATADARRARAEQRQARAEVALGKTPVPRTHGIQGNQLLVIDTPVSDGSGFVENQRCFVWRDQEFKTATMSCPQQAEVLISSE